MAYGKKYEITNVKTATKSSIGGNTTWVIEIYQDGYAGGVSDLIGTGDMLGFDWQPSRPGLFAPLMPCSCIINILSQSEGQYNEFRSAGISEYYCVIKKNGADYWSGAYRSETYQEQYIDTPYAVSLSFNCGLADLQFFEYEDAGLLYNGDEDVLTIVLNCLNKIQPNRNVVEIINLLEDSFTTGTSDGMLDQAFLTQGFFTEPDVDGASRGISCYRVLEGIMGSLKATLFQLDNKWWIIRTEELLGVTYWQIEVDPAGVVQSFGGLTNTHGNFNNPSGAGDPFTWASQDQVLTTLEAYNRIKYVYRYMGSTRIGSNIITNSEFTAGQTNWIAADPPQPRYWTQSAALSAISGAIEFGFRRNNLEGMIWTNAAILSALGSNNDKFLTAIEDTEAAKTQKVLFLTTSDKFIINFSGEITKTFDIGVDNIVSFAPGMSYEVEFPFLLQISGGDYLRGDNKTGLSWGSVGTFSIFVAAPSQETGQVFAIDEFEIIQETPTIPASGKNAIEFQMFIPVTRNVQNQIGGTMISTDNIWLDYVRLQHLPADKSYSDIKEIGKVVENDIIRSNPLSDNILNIIVSHGDGPMETAMGSYRLSDGSITSKWHKRGSGDSKPLEELAIFDVVERFLGDERKQISGTIISTTVLSLRKNFIEKTDGGTYKITSMKYTPITNGGDVYNITIEELINSSKNWNEENLNPEIFTKGDKGIGDIPIDYFKGGLGWFISGGGGIGTVGARTVEVGEIAEVTVLSGNTAAMLPDGGGDLSGSWNWQSADTSNTSDFSQNANHSTTQTSVSIISGDVGFAALFNGATSKIDTSNLNTLENTNKITLFAKFNKDTDKDQMIAGQDQAVRIKGLAGGQIRGSVYVSGAWRDVDSVGTVSTGAYHTAAVVYDGVDIELFIDGASDNSVARTGNTPASTKLFTIGYLEGGTEFFDGKIEQVSIFKTNLTSDNIEALDADPLGELHTTDLDHGYAVGDIIASNQYDTQNQSQYVITYVPSTTTYRAYPATTNRTVLRSFYRKYGNVFNADRQGAIIWDLDNNGQPRILAKSPISSFLDLVDVSLQTFNLSPEGLVKMLLAVGGKLQCSHGIATRSFDVNDGLNSENSATFADNEGYGDGYNIIGNTVNYWGHGSIQGHDAYMWLGFNYAPFASQHYLGFANYDGANSHDWLWMIFNKDNDFNTPAYNAYPVLISVGEGVARQGVVLGWVAGTKDFDLDEDKTGIVGNLRLNPDKATVGTPLQDSPELRFIGKYWTGATSANRKMTIKMVMDSSGSFHLEIKNNVGAVIALLRHGLQTELSGDLHLKSGSQDYVLSDRGTALTIEAQTSALASAIELFAKDGDGSDDVRLIIYGVGTKSSVTNRERLLVGYMNTNFEIQSEASGTGTLRPIVIFTNGNTNQIFVSVTGSVGFGTAPALTSLVDMSSTTKGLLVPRMTEAQMNAIASAATGLRIYNTTHNEHMYYNGTEWISENPTSNNFIDVYSEVDQTISSANTWQAVNFELEGVKDGWDHNTGTNPHQLECNRTGIYQISVNTHFQKSGGGNTTMGVRVKVGGVVQSGAVFGNKITANNRAESVACTAKPTITTGDIITVEIVGGNTNCEITSFTFASQDFPSIRVSINRIK